MAYTIPKENYTFSAEELGIETDETPKRLNLVDIYNQLNKEPEKDPELDERRQKRNLLLGSIGDAFSAFNVAYSKARGVQPMVNPGESLTGKLRDRYDRLNKEYQARFDAFNAGLFKAWQSQGQQDISCLFCCVLSRILFQLLPAYILLPL